MYKCIETFTDSDNITWSIGDTIDWVDLTYFTEEEKKHFEKIKE